MHSPDVMLEATQWQLAYTENEGHAQSILRFVNQPYVVDVMAVYASVTLVTPVLQLQRSGRCSVHSWGGTIIR